MSRLEWHKPGDKQFEVGIDRGVFYFGDEDMIGTPWNGLTSVEVSPEGAQLAPVYMDGHVRAFSVTPGRFKAVLECFDYPDEFAQYALGDSELLDYPGVTTTNQVIGDFGLAYRSLIGDDINGTDRDYKIHLVYQAYALPSSRSYTTVSDETDPSTFTFDLDAIPQPVSGGLPTAHFIVDTRVMPRKLVDLLEELLYGTEANEPTLPSLDELYSFVNQEPPRTNTNLSPRPVPISSGTLHGWASALTTSWSAVSDAAGGRLEGNPAVRTELIHPDPPSMATPTFSSLQYVGSTQVDTANRIPVSEGETYTASLFGRSAIENAVGEVRVRIYPASPGAQVANLTSGWIPMGLNSWERFVCTFEVPEGGGAVEIQARMQLTPEHSLVGGELAYWCDFQLEEGPEATDFFHGSMAPKRFETYSWAGSSWASPSYRNSWD